MAKTTAGTTRKSHKSRKTEPSQVPAEGPSSLELATVPPVLPTQFTTEGERKDAKEEPTRSTGIPAETPAKQWWYRPPTSPARKLAEKIIVLRAAGHEDKAIAKKLKTTEQSVRQYVYVARKNGWLNSEDEPVDLELELAMSVDRKVVRNINAALDGEMTNWQTHEMTLAAAKGRGHFKNHDSIKGDGGNAMAVVAIKVIMPPVGAGDQLPQVLEDQMGGVPAYVEGEAIDGDAGTVGTLGPDTETIREAVDTVTDAGAALRTEP